MSHTGRNTFERQEGVPFNTQIVTTL